MRNFVRYFSRNGVVLQVAEKIASCNKAFGAWLNQETLLWNVSSYCFLCG